MTKRYRLLSMVATLFALLCAPELRAQVICDTGNGNGSTCIAAVALTSTIAKTVRLSINSNGFLMAPLGGLLAPTDFANGFFDAQGSLTLSIWANAPWKVSVASTGSAFGGSCTSKAANTVLWGTTTGSRTNPLSTVAADAYTGAAFAENQQRSLFFRVDIGWLTDSPVAATNCPLPATFSVSAP